MNCLDKKLPEYNFYKFTIFKKKKNFNRTYLELVLTENKTENQIRDIEKTEIEVIFILKPEIIKVPFPFLNIYIYIFALFIIWLIGS